MPLSSRILVAALALCQSLIWTCPDFCATTSAAPGRQATQTSDNREHHHSGHGNVGKDVEEIAVTAGVSLRAMHCTGCGLAIAPDVIVRPSEPLIVADAEPARAVHTEQLALEVTTFASIRPPDTSPPPGISPLRI